MEKIKVIICDDHQILVQGLKSLLKESDEVEVIGTANNGQELLETLKLKKPNVVLLDVDMPVMDGYETLKQIKSQYNDIKVISLTIHTDKAIIQRMMDSGASGYLLKNINKSEMSEAIRKVHSGKIYISDEATNSLLEKDKIEVKSIQPQNNTTEELTKRETEILKLISEGYSNTEIGGMLYISPRTVDTHRTNIMKKINVKNIAGLIKYAIQSGI
jgi:DNA-binding NarL/FixJ family response regulator